MLKYSLYVVAVISHDVLSRVNMNIVKVKDGVAANNNNSYCDKTGWTFFLEGLFTCCVSEITHPRFPLK